MPYAWTRATSDENAVKIIQLHQSSLREKSNILRIGTFNIAHGRGDTLDGSNSTGESKKIRLDRLHKIANLIRNQNLDIIILNEVDFDCNWSHNIDQAEIIATAAGFPFILKQRNSDIKLPFYTLRFGNAILSQHPLSKEQFITLPVLKNHEEILGGAHHSASCIATLPDSTQIQIIPIHLEVRDSATRIAGVEQIALSVTVAKKNDIPSIVLGDFNSFPDRYKQTAIETLIRQSNLRSSGGIELISEKFTFPSSAPTQRLDWIFFNDKWQLNSHQVISTTFSDHSFVVSEIGF